MELQADSSHHGLFVGLTTLDLIYRVHQPPKPNQKIVASDYTVSAGGPATNAAATFSYLGNQATLLSAVGNHPMAHLIAADLQQCRVALTDLAPDFPEPPPVSSIVVTEATGDRAVVSINATKMQAPETAVLSRELPKGDILLIDGHQMIVGRAIAQQAKSQNIPIVVDGGSWKPGFETVLALADYAICSANFQPPSTEDAPENAVNYLAGLGIPHIAITHGENPIRYWSQGQTGIVAVPPVNAIDTLGAGDIFHGAFCHFILQEPFAAALAKAAKVAAYACQFFGTRRWMETGEAREGILALLIEGINFVGGVREPSLPADMKIGHSSPNSATREF